MKGGLRAIAFGWLGMAVFISASAMFPHWPFEPRLLFGTVLLFVIGAVTEVK